MDFSQIQQTLSEGARKIEIKNPLGNVNIPIPGEQGFNKSDPLRNRFMLKGSLADEGLDIWRHTFTARDPETNEKKGFFIEFYAVNPSLGDDKPQFASTYGRKPSYLMVKAGMYGDDGLQLNRFFAWNDVSIGEEVEMLISAGDCFLSESRTMGQIEVSEEEAKANPAVDTQPAKIIWDLKIDKQIAFNMGYAASAPVRIIDSQDTYWHCEGMKTQYSGEIVINKKKYKVTPEDSYGYADKVWGIAPKYPWLFINANHLVSKGARELKKSAVVFGGTSDPEISRTDDTNRLIGALYREGATYEFNFSKFWTMTRSAIRMKQNKKKIGWEIKQETPIHKILAQFTFEKKNVSYLNYESPEGKVIKDSVMSGCQGLGKVMIFQKHITIKGKWVWELVDEISAVDVGFEYGDRDKLIAEEKQEAAEKKKAEAEAEKKKAEAEKKKADAEKKKAAEEKKKADTEKKKADAEKKKADAEKKKADAEKKKADAEKKKADAEKKKAEAEKKKAGAEENKD